MRLVSLRPWPDGPDIEMHPRITVIVGLLPFERVELVSTAHSIATAEVPVWHGVLELDGTRMTLVEHAEVCGPRAECAPVITAEEVAGLIVRPSEMGQPQTGGIDEDSISRVRERLAQITDDLSGAEELRAEMQGRIATASANFDLQVFDELSRVDGILKRAADQADRPDPWTGVDDPAARLKRVSDLLHMVERKLVDLPLGDRVELARCCASLSVAIGTGDMPLPEAVGLREKLIVLQEKWSDIVAQFRSLGFDQDGATARLESARAAFRTAEQAATPREVTPEEVAEIERLHDICLELQDKAAGGLRRGSARKRLAEAQAELDRILSEIGHTTWSQFRMGNAMAKVTDEALRAFEVARAELDATELEWAELRAMLETDPALVKIESEMVAANGDAVRLLGRDPGGSDLSSRSTRLSKALAGVLLDASSSSIDLNEAEQALRELLTACGTWAHTSIRSRRGLLALGESWLGVLRAADPARLLLSRLQARLEAEVDALERLGATSRTDRLDQLRRDVTEIEDRMVPSLEAVCDIVHGRVELHDLAASELNMAEEHDAGVEFLEDPRLSPAGNDDSGLPMVVMFGDDDTTVLEPLIALSDRSQIVVVGEGEALREWAGRVGPDGASVIDRGVLV